MQIHELPDVTAIGSGGYFATDNGSQTTKIDYDALAKAIIEQYSGSTLAGAAQSVKTALDGLDGDKLDLKAGTAITNGTDVNTLQTPGTYFCASASIAASLSNIPTQAATVGFRMDVARNGYNADNYLTQTLRAVSSGAAFEYVRGMSTEGTWGAWQKVPTRAEVDALNSKTSGITKTITKDIGDGTNADISIDSNVRGLIVISCSRATGKGMYIFNSTTAGAVSVEAVMAASGVTLTPGTNNINIANAVGVTVIMFMLVYKL